MNFNNYDEENQEEIDDMIGSMQPELISQQILDAINDPLEKSSKNFLDIYLNQYKYLKHMFKNTENMEAFATIKQNKDNLMVKINDQIGKKYGFELNEMLMDDTKTTKSIYKFFVIDYIENVEHFIINFILSNKKNLIKEIKKNKSKTKDVSTVSNKGLFSVNEALILTELQFIIFDILPAVDLDESFLSLITNTTSSMTNMTIDNIFVQNKLFSMTDDDNLYDNFMRPLFDKEPGYSNIISDINVELYNIYSKKSDIKLIDDSDVSEEE